MSERTPIAQPIFAIVSLPNPNKPVIGNQNRDEVRVVEVVIGCADAERRAKDMRVAVFATLGKAEENEGYIQRMLAYRASIAVVPCTLTEIGVEGI